MLLVYGSHIMPNIHADGLTVLAKAMVEFQIEISLSGKGSSIIFDGVAGFVYCSTICRHNDNYILNESALDEILEDFQPDQLIKSADQVLGTHRSLLHMESPRSSCLSWPECQYV